jgi:hypothetical protein
MRVVGFATKSIVEHVEPAQMQAVLFTIYCAISSEVWEALEARDEHNPLQHIRCDGCRQGSDFLYALPLTASDGYCSKLCCGHCATRKFRPDAAAPVILLRISRADPALRLLLLKYRRCYIAQAAQTPSPEPSFGEDLTF